MSAAVQSETLYPLFDDLPRLGDRPAVGLRLEYGLRWWSYADLHRRARVASALLAKAGVRKGDRVVLWGPSSPEWVGYFLGALLRGAVVVPVDDGAPPETVQRMANEVQARHLVTVPARVEALPLATLSFGALASGDGALEAAEVSEDRAGSDDPAVIFFTSGTTSAPRGVVLTHRNLWSQVRRFSGWRGIVRIVPVRMMVSAPLSHVQGLLLGICVPLHVGLGIIHTPFSHPGHLLRAIRDNKVFLFSSVPRVLQVMAHALLNRPYGRSGAPLREWLASSDSRFLRRHRIFNTIRPLTGYWFWCVIVGGATLPRDVEIFWRNTGALMVQGYGLTETAAVISINLPVLGKFGSIGRPLEGQEVRLAEDGEIQVRGANVTAGYFGGGGAELFTPDGFLKTGDLGRLEEGRLYFQGRKKEVVVTGEGFNVYCEDVERVLDAQPGVRGSVVIGLEREGSPSVHAVLLLEGGASAEAVVRAANGVLLPHERVRGWTVWPEEDFPRGALKKVHRHEVAERAGRLLSAGGVEGERGGAALAGPVTLEAITGAKDRSERLRLLARYLSEAPPESLASERARLVDELGLSSLDIAELLFLLEARSQGLSSQIVLEEDASVADLHALLRKPEQARPVRALHTRHPPRWADFRPLELLRRAFNPLVLLPWTAMRVKLEVQGREHLRGVKGPCVLAATGHEHASDLLAIYSALPHRMRKRVAFVASRWVFGHYLEPKPEATWLDRAAVAVAFNLAIPLFFPFALTPHFGTTREGLLEACRLLDRGYSLVIFGGEGKELISAQTGAPVVPVHLSGNESAGFMPRWRRPVMKVAFSAPGTEAEAP